MKRNLLRTLLLLALLATGTAYAAEDNALVAPGGGVVRYDYNGERVGE